MLIRPKPFKVEETLELEGYFGELAGPIGRSLEAGMIDDPPDLTLVYSNVYHTGEDPLAFEIEIPFGGEGPKFRGSLVQLLDYIDERVHSVGERDRIKLIARAMKELADNMVAKADALANLDE